MDFCWSTLGQTGRVPDATSYFHYSKHRQHSARLCHWTQAKPQPQYNKEHYMAPWIMEELTICNLLPLQSLRTRNNRGGGRRGNPGTHLFRCNIAVICRLLCALFVFKQNRISSVSYASLPTFSFLFFLFSQMHRNLCPERRKYVEVWNWESSGALRAHRSY